MARTNNIIVDHIQTCIYFNHKRSIEVTDPLKENSYVSA